MQIIQFEILSHYIRLMQTLSSKFELCTFTHMYLIQQVEMRIVLKFQQYIRKIFYVTFIAICYIVILPILLIKKVSSYESSTSLFQISGFVLDEKFQPNASRFTIFYIYENPKLLFPFLILCYFIFSTLIRGKYKVA